VVIRNRKTVIRAVLKIHKSNSQQIKEPEVAIPHKFKYPCNTYKYAHDTMISKPFGPEKEKKGCI
jgi:hypothetical protein